MFFQGIHFLSSQVQGPQGHWKNPWLSSIYMYSMIFEVNVLRPEQNRLKQDLIMSEILVFMTICLRQASLCAFDCRNYGDCVRCDQQKIWKHQIVLLYYIYCELKAIDIIIVCTLTLWPFSSWSYSDWVQSLLKWNMTPGLMPPNNL